MHTFRKDTNYLSKWIKTAQFHPLIQNLSFKAPYVFYFISVFQLIKHANKNHFSKSSYSYFKVNLYFKYDQSPTFSPAPTKTQTAAEQQRADPSR